MFQFFKPPFSTKITNFTKFAVLESKFSQNFRSKASNLAKIQFFKPYFFFQKFSSLSVIFSTKISSLSPYFCAYPFFKPPFAALQAAHLYQNESWVPPDSTSPKNTLHLKEAFRSIFPKISIQKKYSVNNVICKVVSKISDQ